MRMTAPRLRLLVLLASAGLAGGYAVTTPAAPGGQPVPPEARVSLEVTSPGNVIRVAPGDDLQHALYAARPGDVIELVAGARYSGPFVLPRKDEAVDDPPAGATSRWITIRAAGADTPLPPAGTRVSPDHAPAMARLEAARGAVVKTAAGAGHYRFVGIDFRPARSWLRPGGGTFLNGLVWLHSDSRSADDTPHHFIFERCLFAGDPAVGSRRGLVMNSAYTAVVDSHFSDFKMRGEDAQAIIGWAGPGPFRIQNNHLEASGENLMFGGADPTIEGLVPADIEIVGNHFTKPVSWYRDDPSFDGSDWAVKNLFELKNARRVRVEGNLFEYNWPDAQNGFAVLFTVRNQEGRAPWSVVEDVTFSNNVIRHVGSAFNITGYDDNRPSQQTRRITIRNNLMEDVGGQWGGGDLFQVLDGVQGLVIEDNTASHSGRILFAEGRPMQDMRFTGNVVVHNQYGIIGTDQGPGIPTLERYFPGATVRDNQFVGGAGHPYPEDNLFPAAPPAGDSPEGGADLQALCDALSPRDRTGTCPAAGDRP